MESKLDALNKRCKQEKRELLLDMFRNEDVEVVFNREDWRLRQDDLVFVVTELAKELRQLRS